MNDISRIIEENIENYELEYHKLDEAVTEKVEDLKERTWYAEFLKNPIEEKQILFWCRGLNACADVPRYLFDYLYQNYGNEYQYVWVVKSRKRIPTGLPEEIKFVTYNSRAYWKALACSKYLVGTTLLPADFVKRGGQVYLNTLAGVHSFYKKRNTIGTGTHSLVMTEMLKTDYLLADSECMFQKLYIEEYQLQNIYKGKFICTDSLRASYMKQCACGENQKPKCTLLIRNKENYQWFLEHQNDIQTEDVDIELVRDLGAVFEQRDICNILAESDIVISDYSNYLRDAASYGCKVCCWKKSEDYIGFEAYEKIEDESALQAYLAENAKTHRKKIDIANNAIEQVIRVIFEAESGVDVRSLTVEKDKKRILFLMDWSLEHLTKKRAEQIFKAVDTKKYDVTVAGPLVRNKYVEEELKSIPKEFRKIAYKGRIVSDKVSYILFRMIEKNPALIRKYSEVQEFVADIMQREWLRKWGSLEADVIVLLGDKTRQYLTALMKKDVQRIVASEAPLQHHKKKDLEEWQKLWVSFDRIFVPAFNTREEMEVYGQENIRKVSREELLFETAVPMDKTEYIHMSEGIYMVADRFEISREREQMYLVKVPEERSCIVNAMLPCNKNRVKELEAFLADKNKVYLLGNCAEEYREYISCECEVLDEFVWKALYMMSAAGEYFGKLAGYLGDNRLEYDSMAEICCHFKVKCR